MMSKLTRLHDEALRLLTIYEEHRDSNNEYLRRKAHLDLDRFLMENRETAMLLMVSGLRAEIDKKIENSTFKRRVPWYKLLRKGGTISG